MSPVKRELVIVDLKGVLILLRPLKDLSAEQLVTGRVQRILIRAEMFGNIKLTCKCEACRQAPLSMILLLLLPFYTPAV